jgi:peptide-methionine (S)-S-oxide reductase
MPPESHVSTGTPEKATFSGGCFWCVQNDFDNLKGIVSTTVGYTGGTITDPTYELVCLGTTGHLEAIQIVFDPSQISYEELLTFFWHHIDPTRGDGQFCDIGPQYRPCIFYHNEEQKRLAEKSLEEALASRKFPTIALQIRPIQAFYPAEAYHQKYYLKSPFKYGWYRKGSGREERLKKLWYDAGSSQAVP